MRLAIMSLAVAAIGAASAHIAHAQEARARGPAPGDARGAPTRDIPADPRFPFAGTWTGTVDMDGDRSPIGLAIETSKGQYVGTTIWPGGGRAPNLETRLVDGELTWERPNSGEGVFVYRARKASADSLVGTITLRGATTPDGRPFAGSFVLVRAARGARTAR